jgi:HK97 family phage prohead protease
MFTRNTPAEAQERRGCPEANQVRYALFSGSSYDAETRTIDVVLATGVRVRRFWWSEELSMAASAIDLTRVDRNQVRFLFNHNSSDVIGVVERVALAGGVLTARVRLADTARGEELAGMIQRGELTGISIGYQVRSWQLVEVIDNDHEVWRASSWELLEASLVSVPADPNAGVRSAAPSPGTTAAPLGGFEEDNDMRRSLLAGTALGSRATHDPNTDRGAASTPAAAAAPATPPATPTTTERAADPAPQPAPAPAPVSPPSDGDRSAPQGVSPLSAADILQMQDQARALGVDEQTRSAFTAPGATRESIGNAILAAAATRQLGNTGQVPAGAAGRVNDNVEAAQRDGMRAAMVAQLRMESGARPEIDANAQRFVRMSISEMAAVALGERDMPRSAAERIAVFERAFHTTSDFPILLSGAMNTRLEETYQAATPIYRQIARQMTFADFRAHEILRPGDFPQLKPVAESGEIKFGTFGEKKESVTVGAYGIQFGLSRQLLVNDRLGAIDQILASQGIAVALFEEFTFFAMKLANAAGPVLLEDGKRVFHADHGNLAASGTVIDKAALSAGRAALRKMKNLGGVAMGLAPTILLVSPDKETEAEDAVAPVVNPSTAAYNPFAGKLKVVVGGQLTGNAWELYTDPAFGTNWTWGLLDGFTAPRLRIEDVFGQQGVKVSLEHDFGCGAQDYRFGYRNPGA